MAKCDLAAIARASLFSSPQQTAQAIENIRFRCYYGIALSDKGLRAILLYFQTNQPKPMKPTPDPDKSIPLTAIVRRKQDLLESSVDDETVLMNISTNKYYGMEPVASRIWTLLAQPVSIADLLEKLLAEYEVSREECQQDLISFLDQLRKEQLIDITK